jgi:hypothetical protein
MTMPRQEKEDTNIVDEFLNLNDVNVVELEEAETITSQEYTTEMKQLKLRREKAILRLLEQVRKLIGELENFGVTVYFSLEGLPAPTVEEMWQDQPIVIPPADVPMELPEQPEETVGYVCKCGKWFATYKGLIVHQRFSKQKACKGRKKGVN